jgi:hypothetical protein
MHFLHLLLGVLLFERSVAAAVVSLIAGIHHTASLVSVIAWPHHPTAPVVSAPTTIVIPLIQPATAIGAIPPSAALMVIP